MFDTTQPFWHNFQMIKAKRWQNLQVLVYLQTQTYHECKRIALNDKTIYSLNGVNQQQTHII